MGYVAAVASALDLTGRVGLVGDIHAEDDVLAAALEHMDALGVTARLCVGDIADGSGDLDRTCALLDRAGVVCVRGNHDRWALEGTNRALEYANTPSPRARAFLESLPPTRRFDTPLGGLLLCHGVGDNDMAELRPDTTGYALDVLDELHELAARPDVVLMVGGHTHQAMVRAFPGLVVVNAGTLRGREDRPATFSILDLDEAAVERLELREDAWRLAERTRLRIP